MARCLWHCVCVNDPFQSSCECSSRHACACQVPSCGESLASVSGGNGAVRLYDLTTMRQVASATWLPVFACGHAVVFVPPADSAAV
jgi:imidazole glycerol phosphate synthase subunit HisF